MSTNARNGWNAAQRASERKTQKPRKLLDAVGPTGATPAMIKWGGDYACNQCGYDSHTPTCPTQRPTDWVALKTHGLELQARRETAGKEQLEAYGGWTDQQERDFRAKYDLAPLPEKARTFGVDEAERLVRAGKTVRVVAAPIHSDVGITIQRDGGDVVMKPEGFSYWRSSAFPRFYEATTFEVVE